MEIIPSKLRVLEGECNNVKIQVNDAEVDRSSIPILWDALASFVVSKVSLLSRHSKDTLDDVLG